MEKLSIEYLQNEIRRLKTEKQAVILAHYYQRPEIQAVADYVGDSLALSTIAKDTDAKMIVFCGVHFMAETAKILSPSKKVLLACMDAGCPMADTIDEVKLQAYKDKHPDTLVIAYVNTSAAVKALSDVCVTSSNALEIISYLQNQGKPILYVPDRHLANYANSKITDQSLKLDTWPGFCRVHNRYNLKMVNETRTEYPKALLLVHPEAPLEVVQAADFVGSTQAILDYVGTSNAKQFIIGTENGIIETLRLRYPDKEYIALCENAVCQNMKKTTIEELYTTISTERNEIVLSDEVISKAQKALNNMFLFQKASKNHD